MWADNETAVDLLGFRIHSDLVRSVVTDDKLLPVTIGVFADWGGGKTSLMKMLEKSLDPDTWPSGSAEKQQCEGVACLYFNGWLFEGYDDAKSAILSSVLLALGEHKRFGPKLRAKCVSLLKSVNWMRVTSLGLKHVAVPAIAAFASGGTSLVPALAGTLTSLIPGAGEKLSGTEKSDAPIKQHDDEQIDWESLIKKDTSASGPLDVRSFRAQFGKMLRESDIQSLVVLIDDLDRCSPERLVDNLEAIKLFLNVDHTAFVIGADPRIVRHAIAVKYHKLDQLRDDVDSGVPSTVITDYLEKLIQYPYRLPRLSPTEIETYMALLFCQLHLADDLFEATLGICDEERAKNRYAVFGYAAVKDKLKALFSDDLARSLTFCSRAAPLITEGLKGNPRQVKRFLNAFVLRKKLAAVAKLTNIQDAVLVKLMILEYSHEKLFRQLFDWQSAQKGFPTQIAEMEAAAKKLGEKNGQGKQPTSIPDEWNSPSVRQWVEMEPLLAKVDLGDYFWVTRDRLQSTMSGLSMVPPLVRRLYEDLIGVNPTARAAAVTSVANLPESEREILFELLAGAIQRSPADKTASDSFRALVEANVPDSAKRYATAVLNTPDADLNPAIGTDIDTLAKSKPDLKPIFEPVLVKLEKSDSRAGRAVKAVRKPPQKQ